MTSISHSQTPSQLRRTRQLPMAMDTPTPSSSSHSHSHSHIFTSIKQPSNRHSYSNKPHFTTSRPPLSTIPQPQLSTATLEDLNALDIPTDYSERQRRHLEHDIANVIHGLPRPPPPPQEGSDSSSLGYDGLSEEELGGRRVGARRMEDESASSEASSSSSSSGTEGEGEGRGSLGDDYSLHVGMAGSRSRPSASHHHHQSQPQQQQQHEDDSAAAASAEERDDQRSYVTISRTGSISPPPPPIASASAPSPAAALSHHLGAEYQRAQQRQPLADSSNSNSNAPAPRLAPFPRAVPARSASPNVHYYGAEPTIKTAMRLPDVTGLTEGLMSPAAPRVMKKGVQFGAAVAAVRPASASSASASTSTGSTSAEALRALAAVDHIQSMKDRMALLEGQNQESAKRVAELEGRLRADQGRGRDQRREKDEEGARGWEEKLREEVTRRQELETHLTSLRAQVASLSTSLESHSSLLTALRSSPPPTVHPALAAEVTELRRGLDELGEEVDGVKGVVEELLREREEQQEAGRRGQWERERASELSGSMVSVEGVEQEQDGLRRKNGGADRARRSPAPAPEINLNNRGASAAKAAAFVDQQRYHEMEMEREREDPDRTPRARAEKQPRQMEKEKEQEQRWAAPETPVREGRSFIDATEIDRLRLQLAEAEARREARRSPRPQPQEHLPPPARAATAPPPQQHRARAHPAPRSAASWDESYVSAAPHRRQREGERGQGAEEQPDFHRAEEIFRSIPSSHPNLNKGMCTVCKRRKADGGGPYSAPPKLGGRWEERERGYAAEDEREERRHQRHQQREQQQQKEQREKEKVNNPRQQLEAVLREYEADFELHKRIYKELSQQYLAMDSTLATGKRRALAVHLKESIDTLEMKAEQVKGLHDLLHHHEPTPTSRFEGRQRECVV